MKRLLFLLALLPFLCSGQNPPPGTYTSGTLTYSKLSNPPSNPLSNQAGAYTEYRDAAIVKYVSDYVKLEQNVVIGPFGTAGSFKTAKPIYVEKRVTDVTCYNGSNGSAEVIVGGGVPPYTYLWSNGVTTNKITNVKSNDYTCIIKDSDGTEVSVHLYVGQPDEIKVDYSISMRACSLSDFGSLNLYIYGGTYPYTTNDPIHFVNPIYTNKPGDYSLLITDAKGCTKSENFSITNYQISSVTLTETYENSGFFAISKVLMNDNSFYTLKDRQWVHNKNTWDVVSSWDVSSIKYIDCKPKGTERIESPGILLYMQSVNDTCAKRDSILSITISDPISSCNPYTGKPLIASQKNEEIAATSISEVLVFPNPTSGDFTVNYSLLNEKIHFQLFDIFGNKLMETDLAKGLNQSFKVTSSFKPGMYIYRIIADDAVITSDKLIIN